MKSIIETNSASSLSHDDTYHIDSVAYDTDHEACLRYWQSKDMFDALTQQYLSPIIAFKTILRLTTWGLNHPQHPYADVNQETVSLYEILTVLSRFEDTIRSSRDPEKCIKIYQACITIVLSIDESPPFESATVKPIYSIYLDSNVYTSFMEKVAHLLPHEITKPLLIRNIVHDYMYSDQRKLRNTAKINYDEKFRNVTDYLRIIYINNQVTKVKNVIDQIITNALEVDTQMRNLLDLTIPLEMLIGEISRLHNHQNKYQSESIQEIQAEVIYAFTILKMYKPEVYDHLKTGITYTYKRKEFITKDKSLLQLLSNFTKELTAIESEKPVNKYIHAFLQFLRSKLS